MATPGARRPRLDLGAAADTQRTPVGLSAEQLVATFEQELASAGLLPAPPSAPRATPARQPVTLPPGWAAAVCPTTGDTYYFHAATGQTCWDLPSAVATPSATTVSAAEVAQLAARLRRHVVALQDCAHEAPPVGTLTALLWEAELRSADAEADAALAAAEGLPPDVAAAVAAVLRRRAARALRAAEGALLAAHPALLTPEPLASPVEPSPVGDVAGADMALSDGEGPDAAASEPADATAPVPQLGCTPATNGMHSLAQQVAAAAAARKRRREAACGADGHLTPGLGSTRSLPPAAARWRAVAEEEAARQAAEAAVEAAGEPEYAARDAAAKEWRRQLDKELAAEQARGA